MDNSKSWLLRKSRRSCQTWWTTSMLFTSQDSTTMMESSSTCLLLVNQRPRRFSLILRLPGTLSSTTPSSSAGWDYSFVSLYSFLQNELQGNSINLWFGRTFWHANSPSQDINCTIMSGFTLEPRGRILPTWNLLSPGVQDAKLVTNYF